MSQAFQVAAERRSSGCVITLSGELDMASAPELDRVLGSLISAAVPVIVVDLRGLSFIDSVGLVRLLNHDRAARAAGGQLRLIQGPPDVARVFRIAGLEQVLSWIEPETALA